MDALGITNLHKTYTNGFVALKDINLTVRQGEFLALLGPNGAGKSTIIGIICSLINKTTGSINIFGHDINTDSLDAKRFLGVVPQEFNFNVFEPVEEILVNQAGYYGIERKTAFKRAEQHLRRLELWDKRRAMAIQLSGGMKRRLMIARALMHNPSLLILDEPTAGVDIEIRRSMWQFLTEINQQGTTIILTTHYLEEAERLCKRIAIINEGKIITDCDIKTLLNELDSECLILNLKTSLAKAPEISPYPMRLLDDTTLEVELKKTESLNHLFAHLNAKGIEILNMRNKNNRLEQLFLNLVNQNNSYL